MNWVSSIYEIHVLATPVSNELRLFDTLLSGGSFEGGPSRSLTRRAPYLPFACRVSGPCEKTMVIALDDTPSKHYYYL
jgi:hypothetical protein